MNMTKVNLRTLLFVLIGIIILIVSDILGDVRGGSQRGADAIQRLQEVRGSPGSMTETRPWLTLAALVVLLATIVLEGTWLRIDP